MSLLQKVQAVLANLTDSKAEFVEALAEKGVTASQSDSLWRLIERIRSISGDYHGNVVQTIAKTEAFNLDEQLAAFVEDVNVLNEPLSIEDTLSVLQIVTLILLAVEDFDVEDSFTINNDVDAMFGMLDAVEIGDDESVVERIYTLITVCAELLEVGDSIVFPADKVSVVTDGVGYTDVLVVEVEEIAV
jgi:hypothetical protein